MFLGYKSMYEIAMVHRILVLLNQTTIVGCTGTTKIILNCSSQRKAILRLKNVTYQPDLYKNLISHIRLLHSGYQLVKQNLSETVYINCKTGHNLQFVMKHDLYVLDQTTTTHTINAVADYVKFIKWHNQLNHADMKQIAKIISPILKPGEETKSTTKICFGCAQGQAKRISYRNTHHYVATRSLESLNAGLCCNRARTYYVNTHCKCLRKRKICSENLLI